MMESYDDDCILSEDNIYEILTRVSLLSIPSCISVCKSWRRFAYQPCFGEAHSLRTTAASGFIIQTPYYNKYQHAFMAIHNSYAQPLPISSLLPGRPQTICIEASAPNYGLLLCSVNPEYKRKNHTNHHFYITRVGSTPYNLPIPNPKTRFETCGFAIICGTHKINQTNYEFKIVRISEQNWVELPMRRNLKYCEIFDSNAQKWRRSKDLPYISLRDNIGIVIKQTAYWMIYNLHNVDAFFSSFSIFAFNVEEERGMTITGPDATSITSNKRYNWRMIPYDERLCLVHMSGNDINVWMMKVASYDENTQQWEWKGSYTRQYVKNRKFALEDGIPNQKVVLLESLYRELWYNLQGRELVSYSCSQTSVFRISMNRNI